MTFIDSHAHLDFADFKDDLAVVLLRAQEAEVKFIINIATDHKSVLNSLELSEKYNYIYTALGIHPHEADKVSDDDLALVEKHLSHPKVVAVGEIGLDFHRHYADHNNQRRLFRQMISLAKKVKKPLVIHNRNAFKETVKILEEEGARELGGVFHCFAGDPDEGRRVLELGFNLSFTGNLTFPKSHLPVIAKAIPIERILLETDCPFLSPQQYRGQRCEPAFIRYTAEKLAEIKALSIEDIARITSNNVFRIFGVGPKPPSEIVYPIRNSLYLNLTNRCSCDCVFCPRNKNPIVKGHYLKLEQEPNFEAVVKAVEAYPSNFKELVFCGYGEPTIRFELLKQLARYFRNRFPRIRLDTNGHGNLINERDITGELVGLIDAVSVSLNSADVDTYLKLNRPIFGERGYGGMLDFIKKCRNLGIETMVTIVGYPGVDTAKSQQLAKELGVKFRLRKYNDLG